MTDTEDRTKAIEQWRATIDALATVVQEAIADTGIDPAEAEEVRRLIMLRIASRRRDSLPAAWAGRRGIVMTMASETEPLPEAQGRGPENPPEPRPAWRD